MLMDSNVYANNKKKMLICWLMFNVIIMQMIDYKLLVILLLCTDSVNIELH